MESAVKKTSTQLADGRELVYYDLRDDTVRDAADRRPLDRTVTTSEVMICQTGVSELERPSRITLRA